MRFDNQKLLLGSLGALGVIGGVVAKNSAEQFPMLGLPENLGPALFVGGWGLVAYTNALNAANTNIVYDQKSALGLLSAASIVGSVFMMKQLKRQGQPVGALYPALFAGGWIALAYAICQRRGPLKFAWPNTQRCALSFGAAALVLTSMMYVLPRQRMLKIVDGPGMAMFAAGWALIVAALAHKADN